VEANGTGHDGHEPADDGPDDYDRAEREAIQSETPLEPTEE